MQNTTTHTPQDLARMARMSACPPRSPAGAARFIATSALEELGDLSTQDMALLLAAIIEVTKES